MNKLWVGNYPLGVEKKIALDFTETLNDLFDEVCRTYPSNRAFTAHNETISFTDTKNYVNNLAQNFINLGINKGDRVAIIMPNLIQYPLSIFALFKIGAVVVNINPLYTEAEIDYLLENSGAKSVIIIDIMAEKLNKLYKKHALKNVIITSIPDLYKPIKRLLMNFVIKKIKKLVKPYNYETVPFRELITNNNLNHEFVKFDNQELAFIQYTGATTGRPKGVMLTHYNVVANLKQITNWLKPQVPNLDKQIAIDALPLYHIFSLTANLLTFFYLGSENVMIVNPRDIKEVVKTLSRTPFTIFSALDTLYNLLLQSKEFRRYKYPFFKYSVAGGMPIRDSVAREWFNLTKVMPANCYGLTESSPAVSLNPLDNSYDGSVGFPVASLDIEIRDIDTSRIMGIDKIGVVWIKGPQVTSGYWQNPLQTKLVIDENGWLNTHDLGYISNNGKLFLSGRESEMVIISGFNVYPAEIERVVNNFPEIKEAAVIGQVMEDGIEKLVLFISYKPNKILTNEEIIDRCKKVLAPYKIPHLINAYDELPKTLVGKIDKKALIATLK